MTLASFYGTFPDMKKTLKEEWRPAVGLEGYYEVSSLGNLRRVKPGKNARLYENRKFSKAPNGYLNTEVYLDGTRATVHLHRLVALTFVGQPPDGKPQVNHKNGNKTDNRAVNLEWVSQSENMRHAQRELGWIGRPGVGVVKLDHGGNLVGRFDSATDAAKSIGGGLSVRKNISLVCSRQHRRISSPPYRYSVRGFIWLYASDYSPEFVKEVLSQIKMHRRPNRCVKTSQITTARES